ncbi:hypothetical protein MRX96_009974 [Rhipicephalus microplus]
MTPRSVSNFGLRSTQPCLKHFYRIAEVAYKDCGLFCIRGWEVPSHLGGGGGNFRESGGFRQTEGHRVEEGFKQTDFFNRGQGNGAAFLGTNAGVLESGLVQQVKGKFKIMGKLRGYSAAGSSLQQQG